MNRALCIHGAPTLVGKDDGFYSWVALARKVRRKKDEGRRTDLSSAAPSSFILRPSSFAARRGFTLLEMIIVLVIIAILAGATMPAFNSAVNEHRIREDGHQLAMMVRTAMIQSNEQHRPYIIELTKSSMSLHPVGELAKDSNNPDATLFRDSGSTSTNANQPVEDNVTEDVDVQQQLDGANKLQVPDATKTNGWIDMPKDGTQWVFQPGQLCPATGVRVARGDAYLELNFEALTGNVAGEKSYFP